VDLRMLGRTFRLRRGSEGWLWADEGGEVSGGCGQTKEGK
jgi:hypothetical protein